MFLIPLLLINLFLLFWVQNSFYFVYQVFGFFKCVVEVFLVCVLFAVLEGAGVVQGLWGGDYCAAARWTRIPSQIHCLVFSRVLLVKFFKLVILLSQ